ncbi:MAG: putative maltokinase, partial [Myxococcota bacterium]
AFSSALLQAMTRRRRFRGDRGHIEVSSTRELKRALRGAQCPEPKIGQADQSNTSINYGDRFILKLIRRLEPGVNPELEVGRFLTEHGGFANVAPVVGSIEYRVGKEEPQTLAILQNFVPNAGDAWRFTLDALGRFFERVATRADREQFPELPSGKLFEQLERETPELAIALIGPYLAHAEMLGRRTAEMHLALASNADHPDFAPVRFTVLYQRSLYQSVRTRSARSFSLLRKSASTLPEPLQPTAAKLLEREPEFRERLGAILDHKLGASRIRCHGDYHLGQVLFTGNDFVIIDFEGEPMRPIGERRFKRSPLRDVAGMLRSFHYIAVNALMTEGVRTDDQVALRPWSEFWRAWVSLAFLRSYFERAAEGLFLPSDPDDVEIMLDFFLLEKAIYELEYELNNRPDWVPIPLQGLLMLLDSGD